MKKTKILQFSKFYPPAVGGIEQVVYDIVNNGTSESLYNHDVLCFNHNIGKSDEVTVTENNKIMRMHTYKVVASTPLSLSILFKFLRIRNDYDYIHFHVPNPIATIASFFVKRNKYIVHWHSDIVKQKKLLFFFKPFQNIMLRRSAKIIVTSDKYGQESTQLKPFINKIVTVPIGISTDKKPININLFQEIKSKHPNKKIVFSLGRLAYYKGFEYLIRSAEYLGDDVLIIIGGDGELKQELLELIKQKKLEEKVKLVGRIGENDLSTYYSIADIFCMSSIEKSEAFGVVQLEAMLYGLPIVSTKIAGSGVDWVNQDGISGITVQPKNEFELAEAFKKILADENLKNNFSTNAEKRLFEMFTIDRMCSELNDVYTGIVANKGSLE
ncbi:glycosyltransferase [Enterobacter cancerogenus]|uniref:glycosyltransferase n=1 Tax=Enterobacter cancerogenus TaxID=69218 RepID=UPI0037F8B0FB